MNVEAINYRGAGQALTDVIAGHVDYMWWIFELLSRLREVGEGQGRGCVASTRIKALPDVPQYVGESPRFKNSELRHLEHDGCPRRNPPEIVDRLNRAARVALRDPEVLARLATSGIEIPNDDHQSSDGRHACCVQRPSAGVH